MHGAKRHKEDDGDSIRESIRVRATNTFIRATYHDCVYSCYDTGGNLRNGLGRGASSGHNASLLFIGRSMFDMCGVIGTLKPRSANARRARTRGQTDVV